MDVFREDVSCGGVEVGSFFLFFLSNDFGKVPFVTIEEQDLP